MMLPNEIKTILKTINNAGSEAYAVGGCVRDLLCEKNPKDWDVATSATPEEIQTLFPDSHYENNFGTVIVKTESADPTLAVVEVTTYRKEEAYTDKRRPDRVTFTQSLKEDLQRRDFTMNAIAMSADGAILDPFDGEKDLETKAIRAVGDANKRFNEDALRLLRAVRFIAELGFTIEEKTIVALNKHANSIKQIAWERIGDEFKKLIMGPKKEWVELAIETLHETDLLSHIMPELEEGVGVKQAGHHTYHVWEHNLYSLGFAVTFEYEFDVRLGALLHDVGKPRSKKGEGENATFYNHEIIGATMTHEILTRLRYSKALIKKVRKLVRWHLFYYEVDEVTPAAIRRLIKSVGKENI